MLKDISSSYFDAVHFIRPKVFKKNSPKTFHQGTVETNLRRQLKSIEVGREVREDVRVCMCL